VTNVFLLLQGLQRMKILRTEDDSYRYSDDPSTPSALLATILRDGPEVGVHVIAWCDSYGNAGRVLERRTMREFGMRVGASMSVDDSQAFLDDAVASKIDKPHRAIFSEEERPGQLDKFRPYSIPTSEYVEQVGHTLRARANQTT